MYMHTCVYMNIIYHKIAGTLSNYTSPPYIAISTTLNEHTTYLNISQRKLS